MAQSPEGKVKDFIRRRMKKEFPGIWYYSPPGGPFGQAGIPDHFYMIEKVFIAIEAKAGKNTATPAQLKQLELLGNQGCVVAIVTGKDVAKMDLIVSTIRTEIAIRAARARVSSG